MNKIFAPTGDASYDIVMNPETMGYSCSRFGVRDLGSEIWGQSKNPRELESFYSDPKCPKCPILMEAVRRVDKTLDAPVEPDDEYVYYSN
jgi:hypothetical protein